MMSPDRVRRLMLDYKKLTARQKQWFELYGEGHSSVEIAEMMGVTPNTVKTHMYNMRNKMTFYHDRSLRAQAAYLLGYMRGKYE
jgi:DNA-binding CsgD family transcriptional regulator